MNAAVFAIQPNNVLIEVNSTGQFIISGELNFTTVPPLHLRGCQLIAASPQPVFDLKQVSVDDNAGLVLVIAWLRYAKSLRKTIKLLNIPSQLLAMAKVCGLLQIIEATSK